MGRRAEEGTNRNFTILRVCVCVCVCVFFFYSPHEDDDLTGCYVQRFACFLLLLSLDPAFLLSCL